MLLLKALLKISYAFSTAPYYYNFESRQINKSKFNKFYSVCTILLIIIGFFYSAIFINNTELQQDNSSQSQQIGNLLEMLSSLLLTIAAITAVATTLFMSEKWQYILEQLQNVNVKLGFWDDEHKNRIYFNLFLCYLPKISKDVYCVFVYNSRGLPKYFICNTIFEYYCFASTLLIVCLGLIFKSKYKMLMVLLKREVQIKNSNNYLRATSKLFRLLNTILENYNGIFGYQLLFMLGHTLISVLQTFDYCLKFKQIASPDILFANLCSTGFNLIKCSIVIIACDVTTREADKMLDICYGLEEQFPATSIERKEVLKLVRLVRYKSPYFSAAGFFNVDRKTLFGFLNVTTTYFIIIIQFNQS